jgi:hypothetical protein
MSGTDVSGVNSRPKMTRLTRAVDIAKHVQVIAADAVRAIHQAGHGNRKVCAKNARTSLRFNLAKIIRHTLTRKAYPSAYRKAAR